MAKMEEVPGHVFNYDLLVNEDHVKSVKISYPQLAHVLDFPRLRILFKKHNAYAEASKNRSRLLGWMAIGTGFVSLTLTAGQVVYPIWGLTEIGRFLLTICGILFGVLSVCIGTFGLFFQKFKQRWLLERLISERLRQAHYQQFVSRPLEISRTIQDHTAMSAFLQTRDGDLEAAYETMLTNPAATLSRIISDDFESDIWLFDQPVEIDKETAETIPDQFFQAYLNLRLRQQSNYAFWRLANDRIAKFFGLRIQQAFLTFLFFAIVILVLFMSIAEATLLLYFQWDFDRAIFPILSFLALFFALTAMALRGLEEGFRPGRELDRISRYARDISRLIERFQATTSKQEKFKIMTEMEQVTFNEMRDFLLTFHTARFVM